MTLFGTRKGPQQWLTAFVIAGLAMTLTPMQGRCDSISMYEMLMKYVKTTKKPVKKVTCCPNAPCCLSGQCNSNGTCCPAGGCCPQPVIWPFGVCTGPATMPCCPIIGSAPACCQEVFRIGNLYFVIASHGDQPSAARENVINQFRPDMCWSGLTPAGTFTPDQGCPICPTCVQPPKPQGGVVGVPFHGAGGVFSPDLCVPICPTCVPADPAMQQALQNRKLTLSFNNVPLNQCIEDIKAYVGNLNIVFDKQAIHGSGTRLDQPCTMDCKEMSLESVMNQLLKASGLDFLVENKAIKVTSEQAVRQAQAKQVTPVSAIWSGQLVTIHSSDNAFRTIATQHFHPPVSQTAEVRVVVKNQTNEQRMTKTYEVGDLIEMISQAKLLQSQSKHTSASNDLSFFIDQGVLNVSNLPSIVSNSKPPIVPTSIATCDSAKPCSGQCALETLIKLITRSVDPRSWSDVGGRGTIQYYPLGNALVVSQQTAEVHNQIQCVLTTLRHLQECGLISKPTACASCENCCKTPSVDLFNCLIEKMIIPLLNPDQVCCPAQSQPVRVIKPDQCGICPQCVPQRVSKPDCVVSVVGFVDSVNCVDMKKCADELQRLCVEHERTIRELQEITSDLRQEVANLRHDIHMSRHAQPTYAPPYNMQPVSFPQQQMPETYFFVPAMPPGHPIPLPATGFLPRIPR